MASTLAVLLLLSAALFTVQAGDDCKSYYTSNNQYKSGITCGYWQHCCGNCDYRYCCFYENVKLSDRDQNICTFRNNNIATGSLILGVAVLVTVFITCCCCPSCCIYKMCRKPRRKCFSAGIVHQKLKMCSSSGHPRCRWVCFLMGTDLEKRSITSLVH
uniref:Shisa N-terminal domain-containing protein n=1 Tax=Cyprinus carpio TaxID=7962 RepID=A0A8C1LQ73_CYPCA